ncbi:MAG: hypothetical protein O7E52_07850 [Candidatus Poribacteria bacterium]|nr:hypothetical protein [Candidatus Poribacteria bacterium]
MLGYILSQEDILAYYGEQREDVAAAIFRYGQDRDTVLVMNSATLSRGHGDGPGFNSPEQITEIARESLSELEERIPRKYPAFHGTVCRYANQGFFKRDRRRLGVDMVFDIDIKTNYRETFRYAARIVDFLDRHDVPYRIKFSGNTSAHIILPCEAFPQPFPKSEFQRLFKTIQEKSGVQDVDDSFSSSSAHFLRLPYSLNENTGLVSLPLTREEFDGFEPGRAEWQNVEVNDAWFRLPEDAQERMERFLVDTLGFSADRTFAQKSKSIENN